VSHTEERCPHGYFTRLRPARGYPDGWVWPVADDLRALRRRPVRARVPAGAAAVAAREARLTDQRCPRCGHVVVLRRERAEEAASFCCVARMERVVEEAPADAEARDEETT